MRILYINNHGGGFADFINVEEGTNIEKLFKQKMPHENVADSFIRVNRQSVSKDYVLKENDRVTIAPTKIYYTPAVVNSRPHNRKVQIF